MSTLLYERTGRTSTAAQALRIEEGRALRALEQGETLSERPLSEAEAQRLGPLIARARAEPHPGTLPSVAGAPDALAVTLTFEDEDVARVRLAAHALPPAGAGPAYDALLAELDGLLSRELHSRGPRAGHLVLPHELRVEE